MTHMQIDVPSLPSLRSVSHKRPRSPVAPSPQDRPFKRVSLVPAPAERTPSPLIVQQQQVLSIATPQIQQTYVSQERKVSDDWVTKTSSLNLDSPSVCIDHAASISFPEAGRWGCAESVEVDCVQDEPMNTDAEDTNLVERGTWPFPCPAEYTILRSAIDSSHAPDASMSLTTPQPTPMHATSRAQSDTRIHSHSAMPSHRGPRRSSLTQQTPMSISPSISGVLKSPTPSAQKQRVTMGPRPDCEKCKSGVKGHWMHID